MTQDPFNKEYTLRKNLDEYGVEVPNFPMKSSKWDRLIHYLASPALNPFERVLSSSNGYTLLRTVPVIGVVMYGAVQVIMW
ncbi:hypothetical protein ACRTEV_16980 [Rossellomorea arthrocnemi]